jgi:hypothetical protein
MKEELKQQSIQEGIEKVKKMQGERKKLVTLKPKRDKSKANQEEVEIHDDYSYQGSDGKTYKFSLQLKKFCDSYLELYGSGVDAIYAAGYEPKDRKIASCMAYEFLRYPHCIAYINDHLVEYGFSDTNVEKQHLFVMNQHADFQAKSKAIDMYYKLTGKYAPEKRNMNGELTVKVVHYGNGDNPSS